jgi:acyl-CoA reductase-like NAD-dependent aldehyde dehydrogenase
VDAAVAAAKKAFKEWSEKDPDERAGLIRADVSSIKENGK